MSMVESFEEVFSKRLSEMEENYKHALAVGPLEGIEKVHMLRGQINAVLNIKQEFLDLIQGYKES